MPEDAVGKQFNMPQPLLGYETQGLGGVITTQGNSIIKRLKWIKTRFFTCI